MKAIPEKRYRSVLDEARKEGEKINLTGCADIHNQWEIQDSRRSTADVFKEVFR